jgi:hypothetical protein
MDLESFQQARFLAVYGASFAHQWHEHHRRFGEVTDEECRRFSEEAHEIANMAAEAVGDPRR